MRYSGIGGQAVIEGVMMKNRDQYAVAVRKPDGEIEVKKEKCSSIREKYKFADVPIVRGIISFIETLKVGMSTLNYSASFYEEEKDGGRGKEQEAKQSGEKRIKEEKAEKAEKAAEEKTDREKKDGKEDRQELVMGLVMVAAVVVAVGIFVIVPFLLSETLRHTIRSVHLRGLLEGVIRVILFVVYVKLISMMEDIKRVFMYHGAEHKVINCLENGEELTVENVRKQSMSHKRCGTSFLLIVMFISILFFMFIVVRHMWLRMILRILLIPVIAGLAYEYIRYAGRHENQVVDIISKPGLWLQKLTTLEPNDSMIEVAIASVDAVFDWKEFLASPPQEERETETKKKTKTKKIKKAEKTEKTEKTEKSSDIEIVRLDDKEEEDEIMNALDRYFEDPGQQPEEGKK